MVVVVAPARAPSAINIRIPETSSQRIACIFITTSPRVTEQTGPEMDPAPA
jgi:hypothetical protein